MATSMPQAQHTSNTLSTSSLSTYQSPWQYSLGDLVFIKNTCDIVNQSYPKANQDSNHGVSGKINCVGKVVGRGTTYQPNGMTCWIVEVSPEYARAHQQMCGDVWTHFTFFENQLIPIDSQRL